MMRVFIYGAPETIRTSDRLVRSQVLYPAELRAQFWAADSNKNHPVCEKIFGILRNTRKNLAYYKLMAEREGFEPSIEL